MHNISDCIGIALFATLANAVEWEEIEDFGKEYEEFLKEYFELPNGVPSHDTIQRTFAMVSEHFFKTFQGVSFSMRLIQHHGLLMFEDRFGFCGRCPWGYLQGLEVLLFAFCGHHRGCFGLFAV